jgi:hypothetical protein
LTVRHTTSVVVGRGVLNLFVLAAVEFEFLPKN